MRPPSEVVGMSEASVSGSHSVPVPTVAREKEERHELLVSDFEFASDLYRIRQIRDGPVRSIISRIWE